MPLERLQKIIAAAGIASRRKAEELIQSGLVSVNGATITELGSKADPETDSIRVNNKLLTGAERREYVALNKPRGYVTTVSDPEGRPTVMELVRSKARLYPIGRLDFNSEGLLLLTNDGEVAHKLMKAASVVSTSSSSHKKARMMLDMMPSEPLPAMTFSTFRSYLSASTFRKSSPPLGYRCRLA